jgi:hypothetical protein
MFHPSRAAKTVWNIVLFLLLLYTAVVMPYKVAFVETSREPGTSWFIVAVVIDSLYFIDV